MTNAAGNPKPPAAMTAVGPVGEARRAVAGAIAAAVGRAASAGSLPAEARAALAGLGEAHVEVPRDNSHGDLASTAPLRLAGPCRMPPRRIAEAISAELDLSGMPVQKTEVAGPGFINFFLSPTWLNRTVAYILAEGQDYGRSDVGRGAPVQVEFVSANPTGPLGVVNARAAAVGDTLASLLDAAGFRAQREYYVNDAGGQVRRLGRSVEARWLELHGEEATIPEGGYRGEYIVDIARAYDAEHGEAARGMSPEERAVSMGHFATEMMVEDHKENLARFGVVYDVWYSQEANVTQEAISATLAELERRGHVYRRDGAVWLRTTTFGDDKDRVLVKSNGEPTYFLADIAYHRDKFSRGFKEVIDLWGPDHDGHVRRMKAAVAALGQEAGALEILIVQWVRLMEGGELARMSKRRGQIVPMKDLLDDIGVDASRFFFLMRSHDSHLDFDLELAKRQTTENPVYYVQYAHARISSILRQPEAVADVKSLDEVLPELDLLTEPAESALIRRLADFPEEVADAALAREPHRLTRYATDVATAFHKFYDTCRVLVEGDPPLRRARLGLAAATRIVLANSLALCGVSAPESM